MKQTGGTLAEAIIAMALLSFILMGTYMFAYQGANSMTSMSDKSASMMDVQSVLNEIQQRIANGSRIDSNSTSQNLIIDSIDAYNNVIKATYTISGGYLSESYQQSGSSWSSTTPYLTGSGNTKYLITSGEFLYCGYQNNCTKFTSAGGSGTLVPNTGDASLSPAGPANSALAHSGSAPLNDPAQATKILLYDFTFQKNSGTTPVTRTIKDTFARLGPPLVSYSNTNLQYFDLSMLPGHVAGDTVSLFYDSIQHRLLVTDWNKVIISTPTGQKLSYGSVSTYPSPVTYTGNMAMQAITLESDGTIALLLWQNPPTWNKDQIYTLNLSNGALSAPLYDFDTMGFIRSSSSSVEGIACDPSTSSDLYIIALDATTGKYRIYERKIADGTASTASPNVWDLPTALATGSPMGLAIDPVTGDFYSSLATSSTTLAIYHIARSSSTTDDHFTITFSGSSTSSTSSNIPAVTTTGNWFNLSYDPNTNHIFLLDYNLQRVFEILPSRLISPRS